MIVSSGGIQAEYVKEYDLELLFPLKMIYNSK